MCGPSAPATQPPCLVLPHRRARLAAFRGELFCGWEATQVGWSSGAVLRVCAGPGGLLSSGRAGWTLAHHSATPAWAGSAKTADPFTRGKVEGSQSPLPPAVAR